MVMAMMEVLGQYGRQRGFGGYVSASFCEVLKDALRCWYIGSVEGNVALRFRGESALIKHGMAGAKTTLIDAKNYQLMVG